MKVSVPVACEFIGTLFIFITTQRIGSCDKRKRYVLHAFPNLLCYPLFYAYVSQAVSGLTNILQDSFR